MATLLPIQGQYRPGVRLNLAMWAKDFTSFIVPPRRQLQEEMPPHLEGVLSADEWNKFRSDVEDCFDQLRERLRLWWPIGNIASVGVPFFGLLFLAQFAANAAALSAEPERAREEEDGAPFDVFRILPWMLCFPLVVVKILVVPRIIREVQPQCHSRVESLCAQMTTAHPGMIFCLVSAGGGRAGDSHEHLYTVTSISITPALAPAQFVVVPYMAQVAVAPVTVVTAVPVQAVAVHVVAVPVTATAVEVTPVEARPVTVGAQEA